MGCDEKTADRVRRILSRRADVVEKKMFGGLCFMVNGRMCCGLTATTFMVRVGPKRHAEALSQAHARPMDFTGRPLTGMVYVDRLGIRTPQALAKWIQRGVDFVTAAPAKETARRKKTRRRLPRP